MTLRETLQILAEDKQPQKLPDIKQIEAAWNKCCEQMEKIARQIKRQYGLLKLPSGDDESDDIQLFGARGKAVDLQRVADWVDDACENFDDEFNQDQEYDYYAADENYFDGTHKDEWKSVDHSKKSWYKKAKAKATGLTPVQKQDLIDLVWQYYKLGSKSAEFRKLWNKARGL